MWRVFIRGSGNSVFLPFKFREIFKQDIFGRDKREGITIQENSAHRYSLI